MQDSWKECPQGRCCTGRLPLPRRSVQTAHCSRRAESPGSSGRAGGSIAMSLTVSRSGQQRSSSAKPPGGKLVSLLDPSCPCRRASSRPSLLYGTSKAAASTSIALVALLERLRLMGASAGPSWTARGFCQGTMFSGSGSADLATVPRSVRSTQYRCRKLMPGEKATHGGGNGGNLAPSMQADVAWIQRGAVAPRRRKPRHSSSMRKGR